MNPHATPPSQEAARGRFNWLKIFLVASLGLNLLLMGGGIARFVTHGGPERVSGFSQMQLVPRKFLGELERGRRSELMKVFKDYAPTFRDGRKAARDEALKLAAALDAEPYDALAVESAVAGYSGRNAALVADGGKAALIFIGKLSPQERKLLARHIRLRDEGGRKRPREKGLD
jgi:uncharacterized membrane protein